MTTMMGAVSDLGEMLGRNSAGKSLIFSPEAFLSPNLRYLLSLWMLTCAFSSSCLSECSESSAEGKDKLEQWQNMCIEVGHRSYLHGMRETSHN